MQIPKVLFLSTSKQSLYFHCSNISTAVHSYLIFINEFRNWRMRKMNYIDFYFINETKNSKFGILLFVNKLMFERMFQLIYYLDLVKFLMIKQIKINRTAMPVS